MPESRDLMKTVNVVDSYLSSARELSNVLKELKDTKHDLRVMTWVAIAWTLATFVVFALGALGVFHA